MTISGQPLDELQKYGGEESLEEDEIDPEGNSSNKKISNLNDEDWEKELDKELQEMEQKDTKSEGSRGTTSAVQGNTGQMNRSAQNLMMDVSVAVDIVGVYDKNKPQKTTENKLDVRSAEFGFSGAVDQWMRGYFLAAAHNENGKYYYEVHEAWVQFPFLPLNTSLKMGTMFLDVGRINKIHAHDRPFIQTPIVHEKFIGWESIFDTGAEFSILFPWKKITQELVIGATNGRKWGHSHNDGIRKNNPLFYAHLKNFFYIGNNWGTQFGFTGIRYEPTEDKRNQRYMYGADAVVRWNKSNLKEFTLTFEYWYNKEIFPDNVNYTSLTYSKPPNQIAWGHYIFLNYKFHQLWSIGYRYDYFTDKSLKTRDGYDADNAIEANSLQVTFHSSEFGLLRASVERRYIKDFSNSEDTEKVDQRLYLQAMFILGSHPAHTY
ncbi:MAG: hypothetical protein KDK36_13180 [Leptospiraceae bacterium]|nr:hypothetical protein [Leptospiraceae bacterium]